MPVKKDNQRESRKLAEGTTPEFEWFELHATTQYKGATPRPPHTQSNIEELIIIKEEHEMYPWRTNCGIGQGQRIIDTTLEKEQTFENVGTVQSTYYVLQFRSKKPMNIERSTKAGGALLINYDSLPYTETGSKGTRKFFDRPTAMCENYEMHVTTLKQKVPLRHTSMWTQK